MPERSTGNPSDLPEATGVEKLVIKRGNLFAVTTRLGDIAPAGARDQGFFFDDTRFLSWLRLSVAGGPPLCLSTQTSSDFVSQIDLTVTHLAFGGVFQGDPVNFLHLRREQMIAVDGPVGGTFLDHFTLTNFLSKDLDFWIELEFGADMADVFEVRGARRERRGSFERPRVDGRTVCLAYRGLDGRRYTTSLAFEGSRLTLSAEKARFEFHLSPNETEAASLEVTPSVDGPPSGCARRPFRDRVAQNRDEYQGWAQACASVETGDELFDRALAQGVADLKALEVSAAGMPVLAAGIPWYTAPFGRDSILTALEALPFTAAPARDALRFLARFQGARDDPSRDEEPGKIPHEIRFGEMARAKEIPHTPYYGSVDATPLWLILLSEYLLWTDDRETVEALLPNAEAAIGWLESADLDGDGFIEYRRRAERGLRNQGWKDSSDGICFPDGTLAEPPIALVEVQGYALDAYRRMAQLYQRIGRPGRSKRFGEAARRLGRLIDERFWMPEANFYALALDGEKRVVPTISSNPGHLLWSRAIPAERARHVAGRLLSEGCHSGWGIRTLAKGQAAYNPLSYHRGTVWPHDNALIAQGFSNYGLTRAAGRVLEGLYAASRHFRLGRLPELFCGLGRHQGDFPVLYPVACSPQAWASGAFFMLLQAGLGLYPDAPRGLLVIRDPHLPPWLRELTLRRLRIGRAQLTLHFTRTGEGTFASATDRVGGPLAIRIEVGRSDQ